MDDLHTGGGTMDIHVSPRYEQDDIIVIEVLTDNEFHCTHVMFKDFSVWCSDSPTPNKPMIASV